MFRRLYLLFLSLFFQTLLAQNGTISGKILDNKDGMTIVGANVVIDGTTVGASTDIDGNFTIENVKPGVYILNVSFVTYKTQIINDVHVESGKITTIEAKLHEDIAELADVVVEAKKELSTDYNLVNNIKAAKLVVSGISADQILKMPDRDAAQVMQRVPGVTIADNRFVLIRGVPDRYNQVMMNGIIAPSTEIDKRSFSFDLIPAGAVDQMLVYKSGSADLPGDFAGGVVKLITKQPSSESNIKVGLNFGYRSNTTFKEYISSDGSSTDIFGFDNGFRDLPFSFPSTRVLTNSTRNSSIREKAGKSLTNNFDYNTQDAPMDMGGYISTNNHFNIGGIKFSNLTSVNYSKSYQSYKADFLRYSTFSADGADPRFKYNDSYYSNDVRISGIHNWLIEFNNNHHIEIKNMFVQLGEDETIKREGIDFVQLSSNDRRNYAYHYLSRSIYTGQLEGTHSFAGGSLKVTWVGGTNMINRNEPDYRRFRTIRDQAFAGTEEPYRMILPPSGNVFETGRFWSDLKDRSYSYGLNVEKKFGDINEKRTATIKAGYYGEQKTRTFNARYINYLYPGSDPYGEELIKLPLSQIFSPINIDKDNGFVIEEGTKNTDSYKGSNSLAAGYVTSFIPVGKFDFSAGFRGEYNVQKLNGLRDDGSIVAVNTPIFAPLPFMNLAYNLSDRTLVRMAYSRTVNRPEFRELAPFLYYQFEYEASISGNDQLKTAFINNVDLRWEMYPNPGEMISVGAFGKQFIDPIELNVQVTTDNPQFNYRNAISARSYGAELEFRKSLASVALNRILRNMSVNMNAAWIWSEVNIGDSPSVANQSQYRPQQGQSPYIVNLGLYYADEGNGLSLNAAYNVFGPRIYTVGDKNFPTWWELPRHSVDFQIAKKWLGGKYETKLNIQNLLNSAFRIYQDNNLDNKIDTSEALIQRYKTGTLFTLGLSWNFNK